MVTTGKAANIDWGMGGPRGDVVSGRLMNFRVNSAALRPDHKQWLNDYVVPVLRNGGALTIVGHASRSGSASYNERLSLRRAQAVQKFLQQRVGRPFRVRRMDGEGESAAAARGIRDGRELGYDRAVTLFSSPRPVPPKPAPFRGGPPVSRIVSRSWKRQLSTPIGGTDREGAFAALGNQLREIVKDSADPNRHEVKAKRRSRPVPQRYVVTEVIHISRTTIEKAPVGVGAIYTTFEDTIIWRWGPPTPTIKVTRHRTVVRRGTTTEDSSTTRSHARNDGSLPAVYVSPGDPYQ